MSSGGRIPTPLKYRWRRFRYNALPVLCFLVCVAVTLWLWDKQGELPNAVGEVEPVRLPVAAGTDGKLVELSGKPWWSLFDSVDGGTVIARFDDRAARATVTTLQLELAGLGKEFEAAAARIRTEEAERQHERAWERMRLILQADGKRLDVMDRTVDIELLKMDLQTQTARLEFLKEHYAQNPERVVRAYDLADNQQQQARIRTEIDGATTARAEAQAVLDRAQQSGGTYQAEIEESIAVKTKALEEARGRWKQSQQHREGFLRELRQLITEDTGTRSEAERRFLESMQWRAEWIPLDDDELTRQLAPVLASMDTLQSRIYETQLQIDSLEIRAPVTGKICEIHCWPGQYVRRGDPILTIAVDKARYAVTYVRQNQRIRPDVDMLVDVRPRIPGSRPEEVRVQEVGPQFEPIPLHLLRDPRVQEWGLPVRIGLPQKFDVRPGELIDIRFKTWSKEG